MAAEQEIQSFTITFSIPLRSLEHLIVEKVANLKAMQGSKLDALKLSGREGKLHADVDFTGALHGNFRFSMLFDYQPQQDALKVVEFQISPTSKGLAGKVVSWFARTFLKGKTERVVEDLLTQQFRLMKGEFIGNMNEIGLPEGYVLENEIREVSISEFTVQSEAITGKLELSGKFHLKGPEAPLPSDKTAGEE